jgi:RHS repeat-associated protein
MMMPGRTYSAQNSYRYGFNGKENDNEVKGEGNQQDYGMRIYDPRLGKFLSVDPIIKAYPWYSPYQFAGNKPIWKIDLDGAEEALNLNDAGGKAAYLTIQTVFDIRNAFTNSMRRLSEALQERATMKLLEKAGVTDKSLQFDLMDKYVARMVTITQDLGYDIMGNVITETRREWALVPQNSAGTEFLQAALDVLTVAAVVPTGNPSLFLFERGSSVIGLSQLRKSFSLLYNVRRLSSFGINNGLKGVHALEDVMEAGMAFVGKSAKKIYSEGGRFIGWESADGLKRFRPAAFKKNQGKYQANFEQRTSKDVKWDNDAGTKSRTNMHVDVDKGFDFEAERLSSKK